MAKRRDGASEHVYLVPGFFGFANLGELRYFAHVREFLREACRAEGIAVAIHDVRTQPTASLRRRALRVLNTMALTLPRRARAHLIGHSSGGLDVRLLVSAGVRLAPHGDAERLLDQVRSVVTVATPHRGTPVASFFTGLLGQQMLQLLSLTTIHLLRFGRVPLGVLLRLGGVFARLDRHLGVNSALLDQLFGQLLADFSPGRRRALGRLLGEVHADQALLTQLTPEGMELFDALSVVRPGVRAGSVVTCAQAPGVGSTLAAGLDPTAQATHALFQALYRLAARTPPDRHPSLTPVQARALVRRYGALPEVGANDGVVPTLSQVWGTVIHATRADHMDVVGHFGDLAHVPPHFDWLATGTGFTRADFETLWTDVARFVAGRAGIARAPAASVGRVAGRRERPSAPGRHASPRV
jgi:triacylglycerol esterase/lipase EstA (alpha/beta hydrolase family)